KAAEKPPLKLPRDSVTFDDVVERFGGASMVPPRSPLEILLELRVKGRLYRFAAARVEGRTFRGLLASRDGKLWAERFELDDFAGVTKLVCKVSCVRPDELEFPEAGYVPSLSERLLEGH